MVTLVQFQPTPSACRATLALLFGALFCHISTHALREEGDDPETDIPIHKLISTHALREEGDFMWMITSLSGCDFYPRPPRGGRLRRLFWRKSSNHFYPRPPRGGRLNRGYDNLGRAANFYPRPPRGGRPQASFSALMSTRFLPTPSARRATCGGCHGQDNR